jgi:hypothetical protein
MLAFFDLRGKLDYLLGVYVISYADIILILELCGLFSSITPGTVFTLQIIFLAAITLIWHFSGHPSLLQPFANLDLGQLQLKNIFALVIKFPLATALVASVAYAYGVSARKILFYPPENSDSVIQHLSRIGYWLQYQSYYPWPTSNLSQTTYPMNAELAILWTILWRGNDQFAGFVQWLTIPVIMIGIYGLAKMLGYSRSQSMLTAFLWATLTQVLFQSSTTQNDLVVTSFWVVMVYFLFAGLKNQSRSLLYLSGGAFGLAAGTKHISLMYFPVLVLAFVLIWLFHWKEKNIRPLITNWALASLAGFILFGSYIYVQNLAAFGKPLGPDIFSAEMIGTRRQGDALLTYLNIFGDNVGRYIYQLVDFSPLPFNLAARVNPLKKLFFSALFQWLGSAVENPHTIYRSTFDLDFINPLDENRSWFGPIAIFLIPAVVAQAVCGLRKRDVLRITLAGFFISFFAIESAAQAWTPAKGRYFMIAITLSFPLISALLTDANTWKRFAKVLLVVLGMATLFTVTAYSANFRQISWGQFLAGQRNPPEAESYFISRMIKENIPADASIGIAFGKDTADYPLFGEHFTRKVTWVIPEKILLPRTDVEKFKQDFEKSDFLFTSMYNSQSLNDLITDDFLLLAQTNGGFLWTRKDLRTENECDDNKWPFKDFYVSSSNVVCPQFPILIRGSEIQTVNGVFAPEVSINSNSYLEFNFFAKEEVTAAFTISMFSGTTKPYQTLQLTLTDSNSKSEILSAPFNSAKKNGDVRFVVNLESGVYKIRLSISSGNADSKIIKIQVETK